MELSYNGKHFPFRYMQVFTAIQPTMFTFRLTETFSIEPLLHVSVYAAIYRVTI